MMSVSISVGPELEHIKVPTYLNGLQHGPARQTLFHKGAVDNGTSNWDCFSRASILQQCFGNTLAKAGI